MTRIFEELLKKRGVNHDFLSPKYRVDLAEKLPDIEVAMNRIAEAIAKQETVLVYGDYDVDGVTASTLMYDCLRLSGIKDVSVMLPDRFIDGYGMGERVVGRAEELGATLIITVDCGSNNAEVIDKLKSRGVDVIVTDHHEIMKKIPKGAIAVVNPKRDEQSEIRDLCGCGVAFLVMQKMVNLGYIPEGREKWYLDLVLIGTLCDSMTIDSVNRMLSFYGMKVLKKTRRPGLIELLKASKANKINSETIGFQLGPRLNAGGRMESAEISLKLLMAENHQDANKLAMKLNELNLARRESQKKAISEIAAPEDDVIVVAGEWHEGVLGIIAGRLVEKYHKPAFVLSEVEKGVLKGSGRSFGEFNLAEALKACENVIIGGGGHAAACGVKVETQKLDDFRKKVNEYYANLGLIEQEKYLEPQADIKLEDFSELNLALMDEIKSLEPFGNGNLEPIFQLVDVKIVRVNKMGTEGQHLRLDVVDASEKQIKLVAFNAPEEWLNLAVGARADIWINLVENEWQGNRSVEGRILRIKKSSVEKM